MPERQRQGVHGEQADTYSLHGCRALHMYMYSTSREGKLADESDRNREGVRGVAPAYRLW